MDSIARCPVLSPRPMPLRSDGLPPDAIERHVESALASALGASSSPADLAARVRAAFFREVEFAEKYPKLLHMACEATTADRADTVRQILSLMLSQVAAVELGSGEDSLDSASLVVGQAVADKYLPKP
jgi:hypothetical protein